MKCGHTVHEFCLRQLQERDVFMCPICSRSMFDMSMEWKKRDFEVCNSPMPEELRKDVPILCNDCNLSQERPFHVFGMKCQDCGSYNTRRL